MISDNNIVNIVIITNSNLVFNIIEYFSFINIFLCFLFIIISLFYILIYSPLLYYSNLNYNQLLVEFISTLFSFLLLLIIISPALIILLDYDITIIPSFLIYSLGLQWAWQFNIVFLDIGFDSYRDHYIIIIKNEQLINTTIERCHINRYLYDISQYILLPVYSFIRLFVISFDVIHTLGFYSLGIKIDAIPGRINLATTMRLLWKGEYRGKCFEPCGQGHFSMMIRSTVYSYMIIVLI